MLKRHRGLVWTQGAWDVEAPATEVWCSGCGQRARPDARGLQVSDWEQAQHLEDVEAANRKLQEVSLPPWQPPQTPKIQCRNPNPKP